jgi:hypothetical protein
MQLFVGAITASFEKSKMELGGLSYLTKEQQEWVRTRKIVKAISPIKKINRDNIDSVQKFFFDVCESTFFFVFILLCIFMQIIVLSLYSFKQTDNTATFQNNTEVILTVVFTLEMLCKILAYRKSVYFQDFWNKLDFVIVLLSLFSLLQTVVLNGDHSSIVIINFVRIARVARFFRLINKVNSLQLLVDTIMLTLPGIANITFLLVLFLFIFTVVAINMFATCAYNNSYTDNANFRTFAIGFLTLLRFTTGDNWSQFMYDLNENTVGCVQDPSFDSNYCGFNDHKNCIPLNGCGDVFIFPFMIIYEIVITFVVLNVFISIIISNYNDVVDNSIKPEDFKKFAEHWSQFDPTATCFLPLHRLHEFVSTLFSPLGFENKVFSKRQYYKRVSKIKVSPEDNKVHFHDVITTLSIAHFEKKTYWREDVKFEIFDKKNQTNKKNIINDNNEEEEKKEEEILNPSTTSNFFLKKNFEKKSFFEDSTSFRRKKSNKKIKKQIFKGEFGKDFHTVGEHLAAELIADAWRRKKKHQLEFAID